MEDNEARCWYVLEDEIEVSGRTDGRALGGDGDDDDD